MLNKADVPEARDLAEMVKPDLEARGLEVYIVSAVAHTGLKELTFAMARHVARGTRGARGAGPSARASSSGPRPSTTPASSCAARTRPTARCSGCVGERPRRWVDQTDFSNDEAVGYLADRLGRLGVEEALFKAGAVAGATVVIGARGQRRRLRLGAHHGRRRRAARRPAGQRRAAREPSAGRKTREREARATSTPRKDAQTAARDELGRPRGRHWATGSTSADDED